MVHVKNSDSYYSLRETQKRSYIQLLTVACTTTITVSKLKSNDKTYLLERNRCLGKQTTVSRRPRLQGDGGFAKHDTLNVGAGGGGDGATDDPDDVARERAAR
jgi:hypothetical protein